MTRVLLTATALGSLAGLLLTQSWGAVGIAVCAGAVVAWYLVKAIAQDRRRKRRPSVRWCVYVENGYPLVSSATYRPATAHTIIRGGKRRRLWHR